jgi:SUN domain-containing protein 1/2
MRALRMILINSALVIFAVRFILYRHESHIQSLVLAVESLRSQLISAEAVISSYPSDVAIARCKDVAEYTILKWSKDTIALQDFALARSGAVVVPILTHSTMSPRHNSGDSPQNELNSSHSPWRILEADLQYGNCWRFEGSEGHIGVALPIPVVISHITIDHIAKELTTDMGSAPRSMVLWGLVEGKANMARHSRSQLHPSTRAPPRAAAAATQARSGKAFFLELASFDYDASQSKSYIQTFPIYKDVQEAGLDFGIVLLEVQSNHGADFTCLYRLRVHGDRAMAE